MRSLSRDMGAGAGHTRARQALPHQPTPPCTALARARADCLDTPHVIHAAFSIASSVLFFFVALLLVIADHELEPMSRSLLAAPHSMCELRMLLCKTAITVADILLKPLPRIQVPVYASACILMLWYQIRWVSTRARSCGRGVLGARAQCVRTGGCGLSCTLHAQGGGCAVRFQGAALAPDTTAPPACRPPSPLPRRPT